MKHVQPTPWCFLGTLPTCDGAPPMWSCPDSTVWPDPTIPCHAVVAQPSVPFTGFPTGQVAAGVLDLVVGLALLVWWARRPIR